MAIIHWNLGSEHTVLLEEIWWESALQQPCRTADRGVLWEKLFKLCV